MDIDKHDPMQETTTQDNKPCVQGDLLRMEKQKRKQKMIIYAVIVILIVAAIVVAIRY